MKWVGGSEIWKTKRTKEEVLQEEKKRQIKKEKICDVGTKNKEKIPGFKFTPQSSTETPRGKKKKKKNSEH